MTAMARSDVRDFGFDPSYSPYHFSVILRGGEKPQVKMEEHYSFPATGDSSDRRPEGKAILDGYRWSRIEGAARSDFNQRLTAQGYRPAGWRVRETLLAPHFGKELVLLAWAVEDADPTVIPNIIANWKGLAPEERWWLYTTVNATSSHPEHGRDRGWRKAIKIALAENPADTLTPGTMWIDPASAAERGGGRRTGRQRRPLSAGGQEQLSLVDESSE